MVAVACVSFLICAVLLYAAFVFIALNSPCNKEEALAALSPDAQVVAIVEEAGCGATVAYWYSVVIRKASDTQGGVAVAYFDDPIRADNASGVNVIWKSDNMLEIAYYKARSVKLFNNNVNIESRQVAVTITGGIYDQYAAPGSMKSLLPGVR